MSRIFYEFFCWLVGRLVGQLVRPWRSDVFVNISYTIGQIGTKRSVMVEIDDAWKQGWGQGHWTRIEIKFDILWKADPGLNSSCKGRLGTKFNVNVHIDNG